LPNPKKPISIPTGSPASPLQLGDEALAELDQAQKELKEIDLLLQQTSAEVDRLAQRNAQAAGQLKQLEASLDTVPRADLQTAYTAALDAQKRLFMMRGQLEKLQSDQNNIGRYVGYLRKVTDSLHQLPGRSGPIASAVVETDNSGQASIVRIIEAQEQERQRLVRQLHDGPAQSLTNLILQAEICERVFDNDAERARAELGELKTAVTTTFQKVRDYMFDLRPMMLDDLGLVPTLRRYIDHFNEKSGVPAVITVTGAERRFAPYKEVVVFRVIQELLANVRAHSHATRSQVFVDLSDDMLQATVEDNGSGFNVAEALNTSQPKGIGLTTLKERVSMLGGDFRIESSIGRGTKAILQMSI
jgi:two-component system, NarL family, sensor histidine kinase DegS